MEKVVSNDHHRPPGTLLRGAPRARPVVLDADHQAQAFFIGASLRRHTATKLQHRLEIRNDEAAAQEAVAGQDRSGAPLTFCTAPTRAPVRAWRPRRPGAASDMDSALEGTKFVVLALATSTGFYLYHLVDELFAKHGGQRLAERGASDARNRDMFGDFTASSLWPARVPFADQSIVVAASQYLSLHLDVHGHRRDVTGNSTTDAAAPDRRRWRAIDQQTLQLPGDSETTPLLMICAESGLAPFRGFVQERGVLVHQGGRKLAGCRGRDTVRLYAGPRRWTNGRRSGRSMCGRNQMNCDMQYYVSASI
ncbi:hypothetical protein GGX14DRAFT_636357 [Mycena pura]|uniref:Uncharacterized protein n=1 Tax=Mycena pura TaxID=153505 RepID=A0AAD6V9Y9_9AGAR|nr:hypothetical protein GGX14DRAFT_636357 [Mycena pura]